MPLELAPSDLRHTSVFTQLLREESSMFSESGAALTRTLTRFTGLNEATLGPAVGGRPMVLTVLYSYSAADGLATFIESSLGESLRSRRTRRGSDSASGALLMIRKAPKDQHLISIWQRLPADRE